MRYLYRFRPDKPHELAALKRGEVLFNYIGNFEDKEEFSALFEIFAAEQFANMNPTNSENEDEFVNYCNKMYGGVENWLNHINEGLNQSFKSRIEEQLRCYWRVCCLTKTYNNAHMWENYAKKTGFCIEYEHDEVKIKSVVLREIKYTDDKVVLKTSTVDPLILTTKTTKWKNEDEIRALTLAGIDECFPVDLSEYLNHDHDFSYCFHDTLEIPIQLQGLRTSLMTSRINALHYKAKQKIFRKIMPHAIIVTQLTSAETKEKLKSIAEDLECEFREHFVSF